MSDFLVKLYELPDAAPAVEALRHASITIRPALPTEGALVASWVREHIDESWAEAAFVSALRVPSTCYLAVKGDPHHVPQRPYDRADEFVAGFACYDSDIRGMFGSIGVQPDMRAQGIGTALLLVTLAAMKAENYAYAVIGWAGPVEWYERTVGATVIADSEPGIFGPKLRVNSSPDHSGESAAAQLAAAADESSPLQDDGRVPSSEANPRG